MQKTIDMAFHPCQAPGRISIKVYKRRTTGTGPTLWVKQRMQVECPECVLEVTEGSLLTHHQSQHGMVRGEWGETPPRGGPNLPVIFPKMSVADLVPSRGLPGKGFKSDEPPGSLFAPTLSVKNSDPV